MKGVVVDASVTAAWCFEDETAEYARSVLRDAEHLTFFVPTIWPVEMVNVLLVGERRKRISAAETLRAVTLFKELAIQVDRVTELQPFDATLLLARAQNLTAYDASYLELALRENLPIATVDRRLRAAAAATGVELHV